MRVLSVGADPIGIATLNIFRSEPSGNSRRNTSSTSRWNSLRNDNSKSPVRNGVNYQKATVSECNSSVNGGQGTPDKASPSSAFPCARQAAPTEYQEQQSSQKEAKTAISRNEVDVRWLNYMLAIISRIDSSSKNRSCDF
ncbi:hypothetical protein PI124_g11221 [Phytophthora idaei]|nr:hypothetical protein PI125_g17307 [Phytophthora idaei]KAG3243983.1 hypothetical protein PI124_g11221 [Phytophthora idaei]